MQTVVKSAVARQNGWFSKSELRQMRLKVPPDLEPVAKAWGYQYFDVFDKTKCVPMREKKPLSDKQKAALALGQERLNCRKCTACGDWKDKRQYGFMRYGSLVDCEQCDDCRRTDDLEKERAAAANAHQNAVKTARYLLALPDVLFLDTETTGLDSQAEIVEIAIVDLEKNVIFESLVKPSKPMGEEVISIHGITNEMVENSPSWSQVFDQVRDVLQGKNVVIYNAQYDVRLLNQTCGIYGLERIEFIEHCAMLCYSEFVGEFSNYFGNWKWHKLQLAARDAKSTHLESTHRAAGDCKMCVDVVRFIAADQPQDDVEDWMLF